MKNFFRAALIIAVVFALALTIVACDKKAETTTAKPSTTTAPATTTAGNSGNTDTTTAGKTDTTTAGAVAPGTTATPTTAAVTTAAPVYTDAPYDMEVPIARIEGSDEKIYGIYSCEMFTLTDEGYLTIEEGFGASVLTLVYEDGTPVKWNKGTIEFVLQVIDPENHTTVNGKPGANDSGMIIGIKDVPQEELRDYFWQTQRPYVMVGCGDGKGLLSASNGRLNAKGAYGWTNLFDSTLNKWPIIPEFEHGDELRIKIAYDGIDTLDLYAQDMDTPLATIVFSETPEYECYSNPFLAGSGVGVRCEMGSVIYKEIVITHAE